jgi:hypothetical protein
MTEKYIPRFSQKKTLRIPSIRLDEKILENLFEILDKEYKKMEASHFIGQLRVTEIDFGLFCSFDVPKGSNITVTNDVSS